MSEKNKATGERRPVVRKGSAYVAPDDSKRRGGGRHFVARGYRARGAGDAQGATPHPAAVSAAEGRGPGLGVLRGRGGGLRPLPPDHGLRGAVSRWRHHVGRPVGGSARTMHWARPAVMGPRHVPRHDALASVLARCGHDRRVLLAPMRRMLSKSGRLAPRHGGCSQRTTVMRVCPGG